MEDFEDGHGNCWDDSEDHKEKKVEDCEDDHGNHWYDSENQVKQDIDHVKFFED